MASSVLSIIASVFRDDQSWSDGKKSCVTIGKLKIQWGLFHTGGAITVTFPKAFSSTGYFAACKYASTSSTSVAVGNVGTVTDNITTTSCRFRTNGGDYVWIAVGF